MASLSTPLAIYERGGVPSDPLWNVEVRAAEPGPGTYDPHPFLTPATHSTLNAHYFPDRKCQYPGGQMYAQQPMWLSLPLKERNRFWLAHRNELEHRKKVRLERNFVAFSEKQQERGPNVEKSVFNFKTNEVSEETLNNTMPGIATGTRPQALQPGEKMSKTTPNFFSPQKTQQQRPEKVNKNRKAGEWLLTKSLDELIYTNRDLPMSSFARLPPNLGNVPLYKRVYGEPSYEQHDTNTSTLSFAERRDLQRRFRLTRGMSKLQRKVLEVRRTLSSVASLARDKEKQQNNSKEMPPWYIPPLPREEGLGEMMASKSLRFYKTHARSREIDPTGPNQKDCVGTRWTGIGNAMHALAPGTGRFGVTLH